MGDDYALVPVPRAVFGGSVSHYTAAITLAVEQLLPVGRPSAEIAAAVGISPRSLYDQESRLGVERTTQIKRVNPATAAIHFATICNAHGQRVGVLADSNAGYGAIAWACESGGSAWGWQQSPSFRTLPKFEQLIERMESQ